MNVVFLVTSVNEVLAPQPGSGPQPVHQWIVTLSVKPGGTCRGTVQLPYTTNPGYTVGSEVSVVFAPAAPPAPKK